MNKIYSIVLSFACHVITQILNQQKSFLIFKASHYLASPFSQLNRNLNDTSSCLPFTSSPVISDGNSIMVVVDSLDAPRKGALSLALNIILESPEYVVTHGDFHKDTFILTPCYGHTSKIRSHE